MVVKQKKVKAIDKWRKKRYFILLAPKLFQERELGQSLAYDPNSLMNRCIKTNLMMLTGNIKKQDINVTFRVSAVKGDTAFTFLEKYELTPASIKRKVRRDRDRLDASFQCVTKDNKIVRIKPLVVTGVKASRSVKAALRNRVVQSIVSFVKKNDYESLVMNIVNDKFQRDLMADVSKIVPVRITTVRSMQLLGEQKETAEQKLKPVEGEAAVEA